ncbi:tellurite resistance TerB family protein [Actibacterium ureilyticum]|uniref:tellurite resistance TerB family protein n=1 Tax=Actibacterium ureilyticum TaxID=1590614 RepID=UPI0015962E5C|nr:tellurite resistance TerB family protein [Actibacterium ureilyticum]
MGLFSKLRSGGGAQGSEAYATAKAVITPAVLAMVADGSVDDAELIQIQNMCAFSPIFLAIGADQTKKAIHEALDELKTKGAAAAIDASAQALSPKLRETALCFAIRVTLADGVLDEGEKTAIIGTAQRLDVPPEVFQKIFDVVVMMQRHAGV